MPTQPMNPPTLPMVTAHYAPTTDVDAIAFPWLISVDTVPLVRVTDPARVADALQGVHEDAEHASSMADAVGMTLAATASRTDAGEGTTPVTDPTPPAGYGLTYSPIDSDQHAARPWIIVDPQGQPAFRVADGEHALDALEAAQQHRDEKDAHETVRGALADATTFAFDQFEEVER